MNRFSVVEILQVTFAGIAFLLAFLAYRLLAKEGTKEKPSQIVLREIRNYMIFAFMVGILAIGAQLINNLISPATSAEIKEDLKEQREKLAQLQNDINNMGKNNNTLNPISVNNLGGKPAHAFCPSGYFLSGLKVGSAHGPKNPAAYSIRSLDAYCSPLK